VSRRHSQLRLLYVALLALLMYDYPAGSYPLVIGCYTQREPPVVLPQEQPERRQRAMLPK
jgi:hypothetical protein